MKNLELYSGLIAGGLGTGYNLIQGDSLPSALAQGAILGTAVGGGIGLANKFAPIGYNNMIGNTINKQINSIDTSNISDELLDDIFTIGLDNVNPDDKILYNAYTNQPKLVENLDTLNKSYRNSTILNNRIFYGATGLLGGTAINNLFQDKSEREKQQLLEELAELKTNGTVSPYLDDYLGQV